MLKRKGTRNLCILLQQRRMISHIHLVIGTNKNPLQDILRDFKSHTSRKLKKAIKENPKESRREWMIWMMESAGKKNSNNVDFQFWQQR